MTWVLAVPAAGLMMRAFIHSARLRARLVLFAPALCATRSACASAC